MKKYLNRRAFLRGVGTVAIGLPLLEEFSQVNAQGEEPPTRVLTLSFGLGLAQELQAMGSNGPLQPLSNIKRKAAFFSNLTNQGLSNGPTPHFNVGATLFTGIRQKSETEAGGPSLEQRVKNYLHPKGVPTVNGLNSLSAGIWSRTGSRAQYQRDWSDNGSAGEKPERRPSKVFDSIFGKFMPSSPVNTPPNGLPDPAYELERRVQRSVLDSVMAEYNFLGGDRSYLGAESKARVSNHLSSIRQIEKQLVDADQGLGPILADKCTVPSAPTDPGGVAFYDNLSGDPGGPEVDWEAAQAAFRLSADAIVLGLSCNALRFASMIFVGAGEHLRFRGNYSALGETMDFTAAFGGSPHDQIFHTFVESKVRIYQHYVLSQLGYVLDKMDAITEPNGKTLLDNTLSVIGTEYGRNHEETSIFHAVVGGNGKFAQGVDIGDSHGFADLYATLMDGYGVPHNIPGKTIPGLIL
ncbi:MAG: hypothetical protein RJA70_1991 [Pseudomonadota bacterium]